MTDLEPVIEVGEEEFLTPAQGRTHAYNKGKFKALNILNEFKLTENDYLPADLTRALLNLGQRHENAAGEKEYVLNDDIKQDIREMQHIIQRDNRTQERELGTSLGKVGIIQKCVIPSFEKVEDFDLAYEMVKLFALLTVGPPRDEEAETILGHVKASGKQFNFYPVLRTYKQSFITCGALQRLMEHVALPIARGEPATMPQREKRFLLHFLILLRNLLSIPDAPSIGSTSAETHMTMLNDRFMLKLREHAVFDVLIFFAQDINDIVDAEEASFKGLLLEVYFLLFKQRNVDDCAVALIGGHKEYNKDDLSQLLQAEKRQKISRSIESREIKGRHSRFGGLFFKEKNTGAGYFVNQPFKDTLDNTKKNRIRGKRRGIAEGVDGMLYSEETSLRTSGYDVSHCVGELADQFLDGPCGVFMEAIRAKVSKDAEELERAGNADPSLLCRLVAFLVGFWRSVRKVQRQKKMDQGNIYGPRKLKALLEPDMFKFVHYTCKSQTNVKEWLGLSLSAVGLKEMVDALDDLFQSDVEEEKRCAAEIYRKVSYEINLMDVVLDQVKAYRAHNNSRKYAETLILTLHTILRMAGKSSIKRATKRRKQTRKRKDQGNEVSEEIIIEEEYDIQVDMKDELLKAAEPQVIQMYIYCLENYRHNTAALNHAIIKLFYRLAWECDYEPSFWNVEIFILFDRIMNDHHVNKKKEFSSIITFGETITRHFTKEAKKLPILYVEALKWNKPADVTMIKTKYERYAIREPSEPSMDSQGNIHEWGEDGRHMEEGDNADETGLEINAMMADETLDFDELNALAANTGAVDDSETPNAGEIDFRADEDDNGPRQSPHRNSELQQAGNAGELSDDDSLEHELNGTFVDME